MAPTLIINEVLTFIFSKIQSETLADLKKTLINYYDETAISTAKSLLNDHYNEHLNASYNTERNNRGRPKKEKEVEDLLSGVSDVESSFPREDDAPVTFCAVNLYNIPPSTTPQPDATTEWQNRVSVLELQMSEVLKERKADEAPSRPTPLQQPPASTPPRQPPTVTATNIAKAPRLSPLPNAVVSEPGNMPRRHDSAPKGTEIQNNAAANNRDLNPTPKTGPRITGQTRPIKSFANTLTNNPRNAPWPVTHDRPQPVYGSRKSNRLSAGAKQQDLFVFRVAPKYNTDDVSAYITETDSSIKVVKVVCLTRAKPDRASHSYKVTVQCDDVTHIVSKEFWPERVGCREFQYYNNNSGASDKQQL